MVCGGLWWIAVVCLLVIPVKILGWRTKTGKVGVFKNASMVSVSPVAVDSQQQQRP